MNEQLKKYLSDKYGLDYEKNAQDQYGEQLGRSNTANLFSNLGDVIAGNKVGSQNKYFEKLNQRAKDNTIGAIENDKKQFAADYDLNRKITEDTEKDARANSERDINSQESKLAQSLAVKMGMNLEQAKALTADKFKTYSPALEKMYAIEQAKLARQDALNAKKQEKLTSASEGQKAVDKDYAKDYNEFSGGGETKALDAIKKLSDYKTQLSGDNGFIQAGGGPIAGSLSDAFRTQASIAQRDAIVSAANSALKATFGGQLSDGERKALANEFYNDKLSNEENLKIIDRKIQELQNGVATQKQKSRYFEQNGTLTGFRAGVIPENQQAGSAPMLNKSNASSKPKTVIQNGHTYNLNEQTGEYE